MNRCPITYELCGDAKYSPAGLHQLSSGLAQLHDFPYDKDEQLREAVARASKMSIQGIQPKLSIKLNKANQIFDVVDRGGNFILKPQNQSYSELPENEDLTMRLAVRVGIQTFFHGMIYSKDGSLSYFIKRFDRLLRGRKIAVEDFAQLSGQTRETKYKSSMEKVASVIEQYCSFPIIEKEKLFRLTLFSYLCGNEDMHLKNFSIIRKGDKIELSPAYDLVNSTIALPNPTEELALTLSGKKSNFKKQDFISYFASERLRLTKKTIDKTMDDIRNAKTDWMDLIKISFLSADMKLRYRQLIESRWASFFS